MQKAHEKGVEQGIEKEIEQIAIKMLAANKPVDEISELTGLSQHDITQLQINKGIIRKL